MYSELKENYWEKMYTLRDSNASIPIAWRHVRWRSKTNYIASQTIH